MALGWLTENGWPSCAAEDCDHSNVPGTDVSVPIQIGIPNTILKGFIAAVAEFIEPYNGSGDWGGWTPDNKVATSNHLGGTAFDFNWDDHPMGPDCEDPNAGWQGSDLIKGDEVPAVRELLDYCEGMVFWGADWDSPKDSMHFQMGYDTYNNIPKCMDFIHRKVDPATMKLLWVPSWKGGAPTPTPPPAAPPTVVDTATEVLYEAVEAFGMDDATKWLTQITAGLTLAQCTNPKRIAAWIAEIGEESGDFVYTEEINKTGPYAPFIGRTWIQITWQANYAAFGAWAAHQGYVDDPNTFVNNPASLADPKWAGIGAAWYWTVARSGINALADAGDLTSITKLINGSGASQKTIDSRQARYDHAIALGDRLMLLVGQPTPPVPPPPAPTPEPLSFPDWVKQATDRELLEYQTMQLGPGDPSWSSKDSTLRDELWKLATAAAQKKAKASTK